MYADLEMKAKAPLPGGDGEVKIDGTDVAFGFGLGALLEVSERTRFGVTYQSEIEPEFDGDVKLSQEEMVRITTWIDDNAQYYGSYYGRRNLRYKDHPNFRPDSTVEQAQSLLPPIKEEDR